MTDYFDYDPLVLARIVERTMAQPAKPLKSDSFLKLLREHLYANLRAPRGRTLLRSVADLAARSGRDGGIDTIVTFNFDDLLETELDRLGTEYTSLHGPERRRLDGLRIIHAHGYVGRTGSISRNDLVFTEPDYHRLTETIFHWSLSEIVQCLRGGTVLFLGLSMSDPSLRRMLDASKNDDIPQHYQVQKRHEIRDHEILEAMTDVEGRARRYAELLGSGIDKVKRPNALEEAVHAALRQADTYDREVFESMGVKTIWVTDFDHIPDVIDAIVPGSQPRRQRSARAGAR